VSGYAGADAQGFLSGSCFKTALSAVVEEGIQQFLPVVNGNAG